ncbi:MAG: alpha-ketoglutarate-dependent dioxygenase AlkB [Rhodobacteraceae bacterium]|nr:alpha-ketoglutarate-dependent dioxygenase AlkB [Paracoccaceae bacterium]
MHMPRAALPADDLFPPPLPDGTVVRQGVFDLARQAELIDAVRKIGNAAPFIQAHTKSGGIYSAAMTNCGAAGWWSDEKGYRYQANSPATEKPWPPMPAVFMQAVKEAVTGTPWPAFAPDVCLINHYASGAKMGLHQDKDETDFTQPIVTVSLGDAADFMVGGAKRGDKAIPVIVRSGDVLILGGASRLLFHGIRKIYPGTSPLPGVDGRYSLTFRKAL